MKLLFCYDGPIVKDELKNYYGTALNDEMFKRYDCISDDVTIAVRVNDIKNNTKDKYLKITKEKYKIIECPNISSIKGILFYRRKSRQVLEKQIQKNDFIIARLPSFIGNLAIAIAKKYNKPYLIEMVGCPWDSLWNHSLKGKIIAPYMYYKTKKNVKNAKYVLYVTEKFLQKRYPTNGKNISCSNVIIDETKDIVLERKLRRIENLNCRKILIATTAAVNVKYKGQQYVIKAISKLKDEGFNIQYYPIGGGDNTYLKNMAKKYNVLENVKFLGPLAHDKVFDILDKVDVYIQPSKQEGLPRALIEAMSRGCLCIGANAGGTPELLNSKYIVRKGNTNDIVKVLKKIKKEDYYAECERNINKSKEYNNLILQERRTEFYKSFVNYGGGNDKSITYI